MKRYDMIDRGIIRWFIMDALSSRVSRILVSTSLFLASIVFILAAKKQRSISLLMTAQRLNPNIIFTGIVKKYLPSLAKYYRDLMVNDISLSTAASRSIIIKMPRLIDGNISRGIIIITFTDTNRYYFYNQDINELNRYFYIVLEPSWAGYCLPEVLFWAEYEEPVIVQATEITDREFISRIESNLVATSFGASDWVNYNRFFPVVAEKQYDSIYVANYTHIKRLHVYFDALRKIKRRGVKYRAAIVCASWGAHRDTALKLIKYYDVADVLDVHESLKAEQLNDILNRSKCNILLSLKEGSNRSLFEAMFCNVPVIALANNVGMNKDYINSSTGMLIKESRLVDSLLLMMSDYEKFTPRQWAMENISPEVTTEKLITVIQSVDRSFAPEAEDVLIKTNDPEANYLDKENGVDKYYFMENILKLFDKDNDVPEREEKLMVFSEEFYNASSVNAVDRQL